MKEILGGKGANLAEMTLAGDSGAARIHDLDGGLRRVQRARPEAAGRGAADVLTALANVEQVMDLRFGDPERPLLVSVRSGARASMPGMMDTVLNLGLNDETVRGPRGDGRRALRVRQLPALHPDVRRRRARRPPRPIRASARCGASASAASRHDTELEAVGSAARRRRLSRDRARSTTGTPFPQDPQEQLWGAIGAVFRSWENQRAIAYRRLNDIPDDWGTAVNVQSMVFGNMGDDCATGVAFTRNPSTGERKSSTAST